MNNNIFLAAGISIIMACSGCTHYYYAPSSANIPLLRNKHDVKVNAGYSKGDDAFKGADLQLAYAATPKIGLMLNAFFAGKTEANGTDDYPYATGSGKGHYMEAGTGYYKAFNKQKTWIFEGYGGGGFGSEQHTYGSIKSETAKLNFSKFFIQPSIGYRSKGDYLEIAFGAKVSTLNLKIKENKVSGDDGEIQQLNYISQHPFSILWEPSLMFCAGGENVKFCLRMTTSKNLNNANFPQEHINYNLGVRVTIK